MRFLVDAQLPRRLADRLRREGFEVLHTLDLPLRNQTPDSSLSHLSVRDQYILVTKDEDFVSSFHLQRLPRKLLLVSTGNIKNAELETLFLASLAEIVAGFQEFDFLELTRKTVICHV
jgi:predicted nuclease of predicted toxin-antitoxin system